MNRILRDLLCYRMPASVMAAEIYNDDNYCSGRSPPLVPVCPKVKPSASRDSLDLLPSRSPSPWELRPVYFVLLRIDRKLTENSETNDKLQISTQGHRRQKAPLIQEGGNGIDNRQLCKGTQS